MPKPGEHKTVQSRIIEYAEAIGWTFVPREDAEQRRGFDPDVPPKDRAKGRSLFFDDLLDEKVREFNPRYAEFLSLAEAEGVADIEELNKILERAVNLKNFLKGKERIKKVAQFVAKHYRENVEPLGYKAFLVGVDREACAHCKHALDQFLPLPLLEPLTQPGPDFQFDQTVSW